MISPSRSSSSSSFTKLTDPPSLVPEEEDTSSIQTRTTAEDTTFTMDSDDSPGGRSLENNHSNYYSCQPRDERKLFVGGLPQNITNKQFRSFFKQFGTLLDSVVLMNKESKRPRGFGFVKFQDIGVARKLLALSQKTKGGLKMQGKTIELKIAEPKGAVLATGVHLHEQRSGATPPPYNNMFMAPAPELIHVGVPAPLTYVYPHAAPFPSPYDYMSIVMSQCYDPVMMMEPSTGMYYYPYPVPPLGPNACQSW